MGTWGAGTFQSDAALDFISNEIDRHVGAIEKIFNDESRFHLDEDAEGELMPRIEILLALCERCHGVLQKNVDIAAWKARYLAMYDEQIDGMEPSDDLKQQRRAVIVDTFDQLIEQHAAQWQRPLTISKEAYCAVYYRHLCAVVMPYCTRKENRRSVREEPHGRADQSPIPHE